MSAVDLEARLKKRLQKSSNTLRQRQKLHYELAKSLGFSPNEAAILQNWKEGDIKELAQQRGYISTPDARQQPQEGEEVK